MHLFHSFLYSTLGACSYNMTEPDRMACSDFGWTQGPEGMGCLFEQVQYIQYFIISLFLPQTSLGNRKCLKKTQGPQELALSESCIFLTLCILYICQRKDLNQHDSNIGCYPGHLVEIKSFIHQEFLE